MPEKTQKKMIQEVHQGLFGVEGTDDKGLVGDVKELEKYVRTQNSRVTKMEGKQKLVYGLIIGAGVLGCGGVATGVSQLVGG